MDNITANLSILRIIEDTIKRSPEANFQMVLLLCGIHEIEELEDDNGNIITVCLDLTDEESQDTLQRIISPLN